MHHQALVIAGLAALAAATPAPAPQNIDFAAVNAAASTVTLTGPAVTATAQSVTINNAAASASGSAKVTGVATASATASQNAKRNLFWNWGWPAQHAASTSTSTSCTTTSTTAHATSTSVAASASTSTAATTTDSTPATTPAVSLPCATQPDGYGPKVQPDTVDAFLAYSEFITESLNAVTPSGYTETFSNLTAAVTANTYLGLTTFTSYDVAQCGTLCDNTDLCTGFNIYVERDPSVNPSDDCPNPASITNYKCTLWGSGVDASSATNNGQWRDEFEVVIAGSNGYSKTVAPPTQPGWQAPQQCGGGSKAHSHPQTCLGQAFFPGPFNPAVCAGYAVAQNAKNAALVPSWLSFVYSLLNYSPYKCQFFNSYMLKKNGKPMGTYCSLFAQTYSSSQATYVPGVQGSDSWTCESSYSYTISK